MGRRPKAAKGSSSKDLSQGQLESNENHRLTRLITACRRCRYRKVKCDKALPRCGNCAKAGVEECICVDVTSGENISRSFLKDLESQLTSLEQQLKYEREKNSSMNKVMVNFDLRSEQVSSLYEGEEVVRDDLLPDRDFVIECLKVYFAATNIQTPILHFHYYLVRYFKPLYGEAWKGVLGFESNQLEPLPEIDNAYREKCLFFLYIILAILTSADQQKYSLQVSDGYKKKAQMYINSIWTVDSTGSPADVEMSKLENLQSVLLLSLYSLMRPSSPGAWYLIGTAVRLCIDLGLHNESGFAYYGKMDRSMIAFLVEMKRRLFWCCYALDRQVSSYFKYPVMLNDQQIDVRFPSLLDDLLILPDYIKDQLPARDLPPTSFKEITLHFLKLRMILSDIYNFIHDKDNKLIESGYNRNSDGDVLESASLKEENKNMQKATYFDEWKMDKHQVLLKWLKNTPGAVRYFDKAIFNLNFYQQLIFIYGYSSITPVIEQDNHFEILHEAGQQIIRIYGSLQGDLKLINFSWVAINNLFMGVSAYLDLMNNCAEVRKRTIMSEFDDDCKKANDFFDQFQDVFYTQAQSCKEKVNQLADNVKRKIQIETRRQSVFENVNVDGNTELNAGGYCLTPGFSGFTPIDHNIYGDAITPSLFGGDLLGEPASMGFSETYDKSVGYSESLDPEYES